jgi:hypothetical protein
VSLIFADVIKPAVRGVTGILHSIRKHGFVMHFFKLPVSSIASVRGMPTEPVCYDETHWNDASVAMVEKMGAQTHPLVSYWASKTLAEKGNLASVIF